MTASSSSSSRRPGRTAGRLADSSLRYRRRISVLTLTLQMPSEIARRTSAGGRPDAPCNESGRSPTRSRIRSSRSQSSRGVAAYVPCTWPIETARQSAPVSSANAAASAGSVNAPAATAAATSSPPWTRPNSASMPTPCGAAATARRTSAAFSSSGSPEPSARTAPTPAASALAIRPGSRTWSIWTHAATSARSATASNAGTSSRLSGARNDASLTSRTTGAARCSAARTTQRAVATSEQVNAPAAARFALRSSSSARNGTSIGSASHDGFEQADEEIVVPDVSGHDEIVEWASARFRLPQRDAREHGPDDLGHVHAEPCLEGHSRRDATLRDDDPRLELDQAGDSGEAGGDALAGREAARPCRPRSRCGDRGEPLPAKHRGRGGRRSRYLRLCFRSGERARIDLDGRAEAGGSEGLELTGRRRNVRAADEKDAALARSR